VILKAKKPAVLADEADTLAAHLRWARMARRLEQMDVAALIGVSETSIVDWEAGKQPYDRMYPTMISFLGYEPWPEPRMLAEMLFQAAARRPLRERGGRDDGCRSGDVPPHGGG